MLHRDDLTFIAGKIAEWSCYILILVLPFSKSLVEIMVVTGLVGAVVKKALAGEALFEKTAVNILLCVAVAAVLPSFLNTQEFALSAKALFSKVLKFAALFLIVEETLDTRGKIANFTIMGLVSAVFVVADAFIQYFVTHIDILHFPGYPTFQFVMPSIVTERVVQTAEGRSGFPTASFPYPNDLAAWILLFIFPAGLFASFRKNDWFKRLGLGLLCASLFYFLILTKTRGAWMGFLAALSLVVFFKMINLKKFLLLVMALILVWPLLFKKTTIPYIAAGAGISERNIMWRNGWKIFQRHPVIGNGLNTFFKEYAKVREDEYRNKKGSYAHNCYLQMAADTGVVGLAAFLVFVSSLIIRAFRSISIAEEPFYRYLMTGVVLGLTAFLVHSAVDTNLYSLNLAALFWASAGFLMAVVNMSRIDA